jgi:hypothetical protein
MFTFVQWDGCLCYQLETVPHIDVLITMTDLNPFGEDRKRKISISAEIEK